MQQAVAGLVGKGVNAVVICVWRIGERATGVQGQQSVRHAGEQTHGQRIAFGIDVIAQNADSDSGQRHVLIGVVNIIIGNRGIVDRVDREIHRARVAHGGRVARGELHQIDPVVIRVRRVDKRACRRIKPADDTVERHVENGV